LNSRTTSFPLARIGGVYHSIIWEVQCGPGPPSPPRAQCS
jgi:hypothetical protein